MAQLPEFQPTPASLKARADLLLASHARLALAENTTTERGEFKVRADNGVVTVTYLPQQAVESQQIMEVLEEIEGVRQVVCTKARTNLLWIQESFDPSSEAFQNVVSLAQKWEAAVELRRFEAVEEDVVEVVGTHGPAAGAVLPDTVAQAGAAAETDQEGSAAVDAGPAEGDGGTEETLGELVRLGRSAGAIAVRASSRRLVESIDLAINYSLIVVGDIFLAKGSDARRRLRRELTSSLHDRLGIPVVQAEELKQEYLFSLNHLAKLALFWLAAAVLYILVFTHQEPVLRFIHPQDETGAADWRLKALAAVAVFVAVPVVAYLYGTASRLFLKMLRIE
jgi:hypothetical protein